MKHKDNFDQEVDKGDLVLAGTKRQIFLGIVLKVNDIPTTYGTKEPRITIQLTDRDGVPTTDTYKKVVYNWGTNVFVLKKYYDDSLTQGS